jgi:CO/xanthine dehydrogenase Mo-binding subunit
LIYSPASANLPTLETAADIAGKFGWSQRRLAARQMRDEAGLLVGWGMGTATQGVDQRRAVGVIYSPATANLPTLETASIGRSGRIQ